MRGIVDAHRKAGSPFLTVVPEFGAPPYVPVLPYTRQPVVDVWEVNVYMKDLLKRELAA